MKVETTIVAQSLAVYAEQAKRLEEIGYDSPRRDSSRQELGAGQPVQKLYLTNRANYLGEYDDWAKLYQDVFVRRRF